MRIREDESGQMLVMTALSLVMLLGFVALAVDVGVMFRAQRNMQIAADAAAIAAALNYQYSASPNITSAADSAAAANGVTNSSYVTVNSPPVNGWHTGVGYIEVIVNTPNPTFFMNVFGIPSLNVAARSVAGIVPSPACIYVLNPSASGTLSLQGSYQVDANQCGVDVASNSSSAICITGSSSSAYFDASYIHVSNGSQGTFGNCKGSIQGTTITTVSTQVTDPLSSMVPPGQSTNNNVPAAPYPPSVCNSGNTIGASTVTPTMVAGMTPATATAASGQTYQIECFSSPGVTLANGVNLGTATTSPAGATAGSNMVFLFENGVTIGGTVNIYGTLDNYQGTFSQGNNSLSVYAPASDAAPYNGIAVMQSYTNTTGTCSPSASKITPCIQMQFGSSGGTTNYGQLSGLIYAPGSAVYLQDGGGGLQATGIISAELIIGPSGLVITSYNAANPSTTPLSTVALVE
ncbi:MAG: hypothetical protein KGM96_00755 [Acidobacteriota bacterium]|nr:hypothetical protein [Acidobacteriota bacterium]